MLIKSEEKYRNKKGFTLVEVLAVIVILGIIATIAYPNVIKNINQAKEQGYQSQIKDIEKAASSWALKNASYLPIKDGENLTLYIRDLKKAGLLDKNYTSTKNKKKYPDDMEILITRVGKKYSYKVMENTGTIVDDDLLGEPSLILKGLTFEYVEINSTYEEKGVVGIKKDGSAIKPEEIIITPNRIDTSILDQEYKIKYEASIEGKKVSVERKVKVRDTIAPEIITPKNTTMQPTTESFNIMEGVSASDNSKEKITVKASGNVVTTVPGVYVITYTASDSSGNTRVKKRTVTVHSSVCPLLRIEGNVASGVATNGNVTLKGKYVGNGKDAEEYKFQWQKKVGSTWTDISGATSNTYTEKTDTHTDYRLSYSYEGCNNVTNSWNIYRDTVSPNCTIGISATTGNNGWYKSSATLSLIKSDVGSSVTNYGMSITSSVNYNGTISAVQGDTKGSVWYGYVKDAAGNVGSCNTTLKVDTNAPNCSIGISGTTGENGWYRSNATLTLNRSDSLSGIGNFGLTTSTGVTYNGSASNVQGDTDGAAWYGYVEDVAGNPNKCSNAVKVDKIAPSISNFYASSTNGSFNLTSVNLFISASDRHSMQMYVSNNGYMIGGSWQNYATSRAWTLPGGLDGGARTLYLSVKDIAGNVTNRAASYATYRQCSRTTSSSSTGSCSASCGGGTRPKTTTYRDAYNGTICSSNTVYESCNTHECDGWHNGSCRYYTENGRRVTGWKQIGGQYYYFKSDGCMQTGWLQENTSYPNCRSGWWYFDGNGVMASGWKQIDSKWYYLAKNDGRENAWNQEEPQGCMKTGWVYSEDFSCASHGWYFYGDGSLATNTTVDGSYVDGSGCWINEHTHQWNGRGSTVYSTGFSWVCDRGHTHTDAYYIYCSICHAKPTSGVTLVCPWNPYGPADGWSIIND